MWLMTHNMLGKRGPSLSAEFMIDMFLTSVCIDKNGD